MVTSLQQRIKDTSIPEPNSGCWLWDGKITKNGGYGVGWIDGRWERAHRVSYVAFIGQIPEGMYVLHRCDTPCCVRPDHLFIGTQPDNMADMIAKGRARHVCGEKNGQHKLTWNEAPWLRLLSAAGASQRFLAKHYSVGQTTVRAVLHGVTWRESDTERRAKEEFWEALFSSS